MISMQSQHLPELFEAVAAVMAEQAETLCQMDAQMGDGDLGLTMRKGFGAMPQLLRDVEEADMGKRLMKAGMKMSSVVPSTMGTLMASGIMTGGKAVVGVAEMDAKTYLAYLKGFVAGIEKRGKCARGERTVLDAIGAAADSLEAALADKPNLGLDEAGAIALKGAEDGVEATKAMEPKYGKAAVHRAAAVGVADQGACAGMYMIRGYCNYFQSNSTF